MKEKFNKKYFIFPIIMIILTIYTTFIGHHFGSIYEVLERYDITGITTVFMYIVFSFEIIILTFCVYKGKKGLEEGFDYFFGKFACIIFVILTIIPIISFLVIRNEEEKLAIELDNKERITFKQFLTKNYKNNKNNKNNKIQEYMDIQENDKFYDRKQEIVTQTKNSDTQMPFFLKFYVLNRYNYNIFYKNYLTMEERYYATFSRVSIINIICFAFYLISSKDKKQNEIRNCGT